MRRSIFAGLLGLLGLIAAPAFAQVSALVGDWSGTLVGFDGVRRYAMSLKADDTFVAALALPNGTTQRVWGRYRTTRINSMEIGITFSNAGWRPLQVCVKELSLALRCSSYTPVAVSGAVVSSFAPAPTTVRVTSPSSLQIGDTNWNRDATHPLLLDQLVPEHLTLTSTRGQLTPGVPAARKYGHPP